MTRTWRRIWAVLLALLGGLVAFFLSPSTVGGCLGPLGVTAIQCAAASGRYPTVGVAGPMLALTVLGVAVFTIPDLLRPIGAASAAALAGLVAGTGAFIILRPWVWTGETSTGETISLTLPMDPWALAAAAILGLAGGLLCGWVLRRRSARRGAPLVR